MKNKYLSLGLVLICIAFNLYVPEVARAETKVFSKMTTVDTYNRTDLNPKYDIERVETGLWDSDLDMLHFWILFKQPLTSQMFNDNQGSWAGILIDTNNDGNDDIVINTLARGYTGNYSQTASAVYRVGSKSCSAVSWMDLNNNSRWLGFKVSQKCLGLSNSFRVQGYADYISSDNASYDYAPDAYELVDLDDYYKPKPKITLAVPEATSDIGKSLSNYSIAPLNLVDLSASLRDSVATIECINGTEGGTGTAWSAKSTISISNYKSYLITNYHVISECIYKGNVDVILNNNTKINGVLAAWDPDNDLAGIYVNEYVPPLLWQGENPLQGSWIGVIGSPKGLPGVLTTGIISSASINENFITFTAPINPGNSGGPVFDSVGRVLAIATAKVRDSEGFAIGNGVPLICKVVMRCNANLQGWGVKNLQNNQNQGNANTNIVKLKQKIIYSAPNEYDLINGKEILIFDEPGTWDNTNINIYSTSRLPVDYISLSILVCYVEEGNKLVFYETGTCRIMASQGGDSKYESTYDEILIEVVGRNTQEIIVEDISSPSLSRKIVNLSVSATSELTVNVVSNTKSICLPKRISSNWQVELKATGLCKLVFSQKGNSNYFPAKTLYRSFTIKSPEKSTIMCIKGNSTANVTAVNPKCPLGYVRS